jgi:hypothetical protein
VAVFNRSKTSSSVQLSEGEGYWDMLGIDMLHSEKTRTTIDAACPWFKRPPEAPPYVCPEKSPKSALKSAIIWGSNPLKSAIPDRDRLHNTRDPCQKVVSPKKGVVAAIRP